MEGGSILDAALGYAAAGHLVLPIWGVRADVRVRADVLVCDCPKGVECGSPGKHPHGRLVPRGLKDASDDEEVIRHWWAQAPTANVGLVTGGGWFVVDCDGEAGVASWTELVDGQHGGDGSATAIARTGGGGLHFFYAKDEEVHVRNQQGVRVADGSRLEGVDVRGEGGYVVAPPSVHASGRRYEWTSDDLDGLRAAPPWALQLLAGDPAAGGEEPPEAPPPTRDAAGFLVGREVPDDEARRIEGALAFCPPACHRIDWVERVSMPLHDHFGGSATGFLIWHHWCALGRGLTTPNGNPAYGGEAECRKVWRSFSAGHRNPKGIATLYQWARGNGWEPGPDGIEGSGVPAPPPQSAPPAEGEGLLPWGEPEPLRREQASPSMDLDLAFPPQLHWLRDFVRSIARLLQVPPEFPLMLVAGCATGAYGRVYEVRLDGTDWVEQAPLWVICAFQSGAGKSPVFRPIVRPFKEWDASVDQKAAFDAWESRKAYARAQQMRVAREVQKQAKKASENPPIAEGLRHQLLEAQREVSAAEEDRPASRRILASSLTTPALVEFLQDHQERCLIADPEGGVFQYVLGGRTDLDKDIDPWVKAFSGDAIRQNRIGGRDRKKERSVERPCLAMALCTQVTSLGLFRDDYADGKGFLPRFMPSIFSSDLPEVAVVDGRIPEELAEQWRAAIFDLLARPVPAEPLEVVLGGFGGRMFRDWMQAWLDRARADRELDARSVVGYASPSGAKVRSFALRLVLMLHVLSVPDPAGTQVDPEVVRTVLERWMPFVAASVDAVVGLVRDDPDVRIAERLLSWLGRSGRDSFSRAKAFENLKSRGTTLTTVTRVDDLNGGLQLLVDAGWIQPATKPRHRGTKTVAAASRYAAHPGLAQHLARLDPDPA